MPSLYSIGLTVLCLALIVAEFFVPSGGLLGIAATLAGVSAIIIAFTHSFSFGVTMTSVMLVCVPVLFALMVRLWPKTSIGRQMLNRDAASTSSGGEKPMTRDGVALQDLIDRVGTARTDCLPAGQIIVDGHKVDAVSMGQPIDAGSPIKVVRVIAGKLQIRLADPAEIAQSQATQRDSAQRPSNELDMDSSTLTPGAARVPESQISQGRSALEDIDLDDLNLDDLGVDENANR